MPILNDYYIHCANGQTSLAELCDKDGNVLAQILPQGSAPHRAAVLDIFNSLLEIWREARYIGILP